MRSVTWSQTLEMPQQRCFTSERRSYDVVELEDLEPSYRVEAVVLGSFDINAPNGLCRVHDVQRLMGAWN